jgi:hypothetical protein
MNKPCSLDNVEELESLYTVTQKKFFPDQRGIDLAVYNASTQSLKWLERNQKSFINNIRMKILHKMCSDNKLANLQKLYDYAKILPDVNGYIRAIEHGNFALADWLISLNVKLTSPRKVYTLFLRIFSKIVLDYHNDKKPKGLEHFNKYMNCLANRKYFVTIRVVLDILDYLANYTYIFDDYTKDYLFSVHANDLSGSALDFYEDLIDTLSFSAYHSYVTKFGITSPNCQRLFNIKQYLRHPNLARNYILENDGIRLDNYVRRANYANITNDLLINREQYIPAEDMLLLLETGLDLDLLQPVSMDCYISHINDYLTLNHEKITQWITNHVDLRTLMYNWVTSNANFFMLLGFIISIAFCNKPF